MPSSYLQHCRSCGAHLDVTPRGGKITCPYCGSVNVFSAEKSAEGENPCPQCGVENPADAVHCSNCGMQFYFACPRCAATNKAGAVHCIKCGINIEDEVNRQQAARLEQQEKEKKQAAEKAKRAKQRMIGAAAAIGVLIIAAVIVTYSNNFSPAAVAEKTAVQNTAAARTEEVKVTQTAVAAQATQAIVDQERAKELASQRNTFFFKMADQFHYSWTNADGSVRFYFSNYDCGENTFTVNVYGYHTAEQKFDLSKTTLEDNQGVIYAVDFAMTLENLYFQAEGFESSTTMLTYKYFPHDPTFTLHLLPGIENGEEVSITFNLENVEKFYRLGCY